VEIYVYNRQLKISKSTLSFQHFYDNDFDTMEEKQVRAFYCKYLKTNFGHDHPKNEKLCVNFISYPRTESQRM